MLKAKLNATSQAELDALRELPTDPMLSLDRCLCGCAPQVCRIQMRLPARAVRRYTVISGARMTVCLRATDIIPLGRENWETRQ